MVAVAAWLAWSAAVEICGLAEGLEEAPQAPRPSTALAATAAASVVLVTVLLICIGFLPGRDDVGNPFAISELQGIR
jgi:hypothetical protein